MEVGEFQFLQLAYKEWHGHELPRAQVDSIFRGYTISNNIPNWARHYARKIVHLENVNKLKKKLSEKDVSMAKPEEVKLITGYTIGGVSPIGHLVKIKMFIDENLGRFSKVFAAAGHPNAVFGISYVELKRLTDAEIDDLTEWDNQK